MKNFLITGSSTGIGEACAIHLAQAGHRVFAGVRKKADGEALEKKAGANLTAIILEVTDEKSIVEAAKLISEKYKITGLDGLVNNAGIVVGGPQEFIPLTAMRRQMEVNVIGVVAVTQAFLPLLRKATGRIVNVGSLSGLLAAPFMGPYSASKFALRGLTDSLRLELHPWNIEVSLIEPGPIATPIWEKSKSTAFDIIKDAGPEFEKYYKKMLDRFMTLVETTARSAVPVSSVVTAVDHALLARKPKAYYPVGRAAKLQSAMAHLVPQKLMDKIILKTAGLTNKDLN